MSRLVLLGAGGHGKVAADVALAAGWTDIAFVDATWPQRAVNGPWPIVGDVDALDALCADGAWAFASIGSNAARERACLHSRLRAAPTLIHPSAVVSPRATLGTGVLVVAMVVVNVASEIGDGAILNTGCTVDHDCRIGDFAHVSPGAHLAGGVTVGPRSWIGVGASVREGVTIGADVTVGAGSAVVSDIADGSVVVGVPARPMGG